MAKPTPDELLLLDVDYSVPLIWCKAPHPTEEGVICVRETGHGADEFHATRKGAGLMKWKSSDSSPAPAKPAPGVEVKVAPPTKNDPFRAAFN